MQLRFSPQEEKFRQQVRDFFASQYPQDLKNKLAQGRSLSKADYQRSEKALASKGWSAPNWPVEHGGCGWSAIEQYIFDEELERAGAINVIPTGLLYLGPVLYTFATDAQKQRWLGDILNSNTFWAQGYSEPNAGSDLASLRCKAERKADEYLVNGEKIWTSWGHLADWMFCLVRTDSSGKKQQGITFLCLDMACPGVSVHPILSIDGKHHLNRVVFDNVRVPVENRVGEEGKGWHYATYLLSHERTSYAHVGAKKADLQRLRRMAATAGAGGSSLFEDRLFAAKFARAEVALQALQYTTLRILSAVEPGEAAGNEASILKVMSTECAQQISTLFLEVAGMQGLPLCEDFVVPEALQQNGVPASAAPAVSKYFFDRASSIYGGTNEIQRTLIAKRILGV